MPLDLVFNFSLGLVFVLCARERVVVQGVFAPPASILLMMYLGMFVAPIALYLYAAHPAWAWMYLVDPDKVPGFSLIPLVVIHCSAVVIGWFVGGKLILAKRETIARYIAVGGVVVSLLGVLLFWGRLGKVGNYQEFEQARALAVMDVKLGYVLVALGLASSASGLYLAFELVRDSRRLRSR